MIVFGGSDGHASFADVHVLDLSTSVRVGLKRVMLMKRDIGVDYSRY
jgi:hypothetical protein